MIVKCSHCKAMFSEEEFDTHDCDMPLVGVKIIEVAYVRDDSYKGKKILSGMGIDGISYTFEVVPRKPIPLIKPIGDDFSHGKKKPSGNGDFTEPCNEPLIGSK